MLRVPYLNVIYRCDLLQRHSTPACGTAYFYATLAFGARPTFGQEPKRDNTLRLFTRLPNLLETGLSNSATIPIVRPFRSLEQPLLVGG